MALRKSVQELKERLQTENIVLPKYLSDIMKKINDLMDNPLKIQRNINQNKIVYYTVSAAVRYIDFAEYLRMFWNHKVFFFSPARNEYQKFLENTGTTDIQITKEENLEKTLHNISNTRWSVFVISHNADRSKKLFWNWSRYYTCNCQRNFFWGRRKL